MQDPLEVLEKIVGTPLPKEVSEGEENEPVERPEVLAEDLDFHGLSLEDFVRQDQEQKAHDLRAEEPSSQSVEKCEYVCRTRRPTFELLIMGVQMKRTRTTSNTFTNLYW